MSELTATIIGYGNPLRSDDAVGWIVANRLSESPVANSPTIEIIACQQLTPELAEPLSRSRLAILIDADVNLAAGEWQMIEISLPTQSQSTHGTSIHEFGPSELLQFTDQLYRTLPKCILIAIGGADFGFGEQLSPQVAAIVEPVLSAIESLLKSNS